MGRLRFLPLVALLLAWALPVGAQSFVPAAVPPDVYDEIAVDLHDDVVMRTGVWGVGALGWIISICCAPGGYSN